MPAAGKPITVALVNDYEIIVQGLAAMLAPFSDRVRVVDLSVGTQPSRRADVALFDTFAGRRHAIDRAREMVRSEHVDHVLLYTWDASTDFVALAADAGVSGVVLKTHDGAELVELIERAARGERIGLGRSRRRHRARAPDELSDREQEVLAMIAFGLSNAEIADELFLSVDTVKTYVRRLYTKLGVRNRVQAARCAAAHGVVPPGAPNMLRVG